MGEASSVNTTNTPQANDSFVTMKHGTNLPSKQFLFPVKFKPGTLRYGMTDERTFNALSIESPSRGHSQLESGLDYRGF